MDTIPLQNLLPGPLAKESQIPAHCNTPQWDTGNKVTGNKVATDPTKRSTARGLPLLVQCAAARSI